VTEYRPVGSSELLENARKYTIFGDVHTWLGSKDVLLSMIDHGCFSSVYLEALKQGDYRQHGDRLKDRRFGYGFNPEKFDEIIDKSLRRGIEVHGIDVANRRANGRAARDETDCVQSWAEYIVQTANGRNLIVVGNFHIDRWSNGNQPECGDLEDALASREVKKRAILKIVNLQPHLAANKLRNKKYACRIRLGRYSDLPAEQQRRSERRPAHYFWEAY